MKLPAFRLRPKRLGAAPPVSKRRDAPQRILGWATLASLMVGILAVAQPIEDYARMARNFIRMHPPSGRIVMIGADDHSVEQLGTWPWPRRLHADLVGRLKAAGARRIYFDMFFNSHSTRSDDAAFLAALRRAGNVKLAATYSRDGLTGERRAKLPLPEFSAVTDTISVAVTYSGLVSVRELPYATAYNGRAVPSMSASLAGVDAPAGTTFPVDYAIDVGKIPTISAADVIQGRMAPGAVAGKDVVIAAASREIGDIYYLPGRGTVNGGYINIAGAETLLEGRPVTLGWLGPLVVALALAATYVLSQRRWLGRLAMTAALLGVTVLPLIAEARGIVFDIMPALLLVGSVATSWAWRNFRQSYKVRGAINAISGLPNLNALRGEEAAAGAIVVAARVRNFAEITSSLPHEGERALVEQIVARLALGARGARIFQGDGGVFLWVAAPETAGPDQLDALHALFRSPALLDGRSIDLSVAFGTDADAGRSLANRIGATLVAADEAAAEGLRWKAYDSAKLADAEWKLSLLGQLDAAIDSGEVWVAYQPQLDLASGRLIGAEALVRWSHPEKGEVSPIEFVLAAEQNDRIDKLTEFVLADAIRAAADFQARGVAFDVAVNISARLLERPGLVATVRRLLGEAQLDVSRLTLEVTESAAMASGRTSIRTLEELGSLGINLSIDDYGTGFSTLEYFKRIPATEVKIDKSFVSAIDRNASDRLMVGSTIELAHSLGRTVVAEGVETPAILAELEKLGCDRIQGYLIGRPMNLPALVKCFAEHRQLRAA